MVRRAGTPDDGSPVDVLALIDHFAQGGAETMLTRFALAAPAAGIRVRTACLTARDGNPAAEPLVEAGVAPVCLGLDGRVRASWIGRVRSHLAEYRPDVLHTHLGTSDLVGAFAGASLGIPVISTIHGTVWPHRRDRLTHQATIPLVSRVIAVSASARHAYLAARLGRPSRVVAIHNGLDLAVARGHGAAVRAELGLAPDDHVLVMLSALRREKGHLIAIEALRQVRRRFAGAKLVLVGQGTLRTELESAAADLGDAVVLTGVRSDVMRVLDAADLCLQPSFHEALPTAIIEAMAAGVPVVATRTGGIPELIPDDRVGRLISSPPAAGELADAIEGLLAAPQLRRAIADAARRHYEENFTAGPWLERTRAVYEDVLHKRGRR